MTKKRLYRPFLGLLFIALVIITVIYATPYYRLYQLTSAIKYGDHDLIMGHIRPDRLRTSLKQTLRTDTDKPVLSVPLLGDIGDEVLVLVADNLTTEDALRQLIKGEIRQNPKLGASLMTFAVVKGYIDAPTLITDSIMHGQETAFNKQLDAFEHALHDAKYGYCGLNCFEVFITVNGKHIGVILERRSWSSPQDISQWDVVGVTLDS